MSEKLDKQVFAALGDPTRRRLLEILAQDGDKSATELAAMLPISRQGIAKHLRILTEAQLVQMLPRSSDRRYTLTPGGLATPVAWVSQLTATWDRRLNALRTYLLEDAASASGGNGDNNMTQSTYDWTQFKRQIFIDAKPERVFDAWAKPADIVTWFIAEADVVSASGTHRPKNALVRAGDRYHWQWHQDLEANGEILTVEPHRRLQFTFGDKEPNSADSSSPSTGSGGASGQAEKIIVTVTVEPQDDGVTLLQLEQSNMADSPRAQVGSHMGCNLGWSFFMTNLKARLEHGIDLRETDPDRAYASRAISV